MKGWLPFIASRRRDRNFFDNLKPQAEPVASACQRSPVARSQRGFLYEKNRRKRRHIHLWIASFFKFIVANLSLTQAVTAGSPQYGV